MPEPKITSPAASFPANRWRPDVWPCEQRKADRAVRQFRAELVAAGALVRIGRELVIIEGRYEAWLKRTGNYGQTRNFSDEMTDITHAPAPLDNRARAAAVIAMCLKTPAGRFGA